MLWLVKAGAPRALGSDPQADRAIRDWLVGTILVHICIHIGKGGHAFLKAYESCRYHRTKACPGQVWQDYPGATVPESTNAPDWSRVPAQPKFSSTA